jgi:hypothetical protein
VAQQSRLDQHVRLLSPDIALTDALKAEITGFQGCNDLPCALIRLDASRLLLVHKPYNTSNVQTRVIDLDALGTAAKEARPVRAATTDKTDLAKAAIEVRPVQRRQLYVDGKPVGDQFE